jgi:hypothetical protein
MKQLIPLMILSVVMLNPATAANERISPDRIIALAVGNCGNPCRIEYNRGGPVVDFQDAADVIRTSAKRRLIIDGFCGSSCMVLADRARSNTCITPRAVFAYHKTNFGRPIPLRPALRRWIARRGGFPDFNGKPGIMSYTSAKLFWTVCNPEIASR